jgi:hypothetical protein
LFLPFFSQRQASRLKFLYRCAFQRVFLTFIPNLFRLIIFLDNFRFMRNKSGINF